jgi:hypothetical protein
MSRTQFSLRLKSPHPIFRAQFSATKTPNLHPNLGNSQIPVDVSTGLISFPENFYKFTSSKKKLITKVFPSIEDNYKHLDWIIEWAILEYYIQE